MLTDKKITRSVLGIVLVVTLVALAGCRAIRQTGTVGDAANGETYVLQRGALTAVVGATGTVRSNQSAQIAWQTSGKVEGVRVGLGDQVQVDQELAVLEADSMSQSMIQAQADLINAQAALENLLQPQPYQIAQAESALVEAQTALDTLLDPSELSITQAEAALEDARSALDDLLNPSDLAISQAELDIITAQDALDDAQKVVDRLGYARADEDTIESARASYVLAQDKVDRLQGIYERTPGDINSDPAKAQAYSNLAAAQSSRDLALANLNWLVGAPDEAEIAEKNSKLALAKAQLASAEEKLEALRSPEASTLALAEAQIAEAQDNLEQLLNPTQTDISLAQARIDDAQQALDDLKNGPTEDDIAVAESRITIAQATLNQAFLTAPFAGTITAIDVLPGDLVSAGRVAFRLDDLSQLFIDLQVSEIDIYLVQTGQPVEVTFDAIPDRQYSGIITQIGLVGTLDQGVVYFPVTVQLTDADEAVKPGMTAVANVIVAQASDVLQVPNRAIQTQDDQRFVYVQRGEQYESVVVKVGLISDTMSEVISDQLKEGDVIYVSTPTSANPSGMFGNRPGAMQP